MRLISVITVCNLLTWGGLLADVRADQPDTTIQPAEVGDAAPPTGHLEIEEDQLAPGPQPQQGGPVQPRNSVVRGPYVSVQVNVDANGANIVGDAANEPSIAINPQSPDNIVIGWRQFNTVSSNFRQAGYAYSHDGGGTWTFPGALQAGFFRSDPVLDAGLNGDIYYYSLSGDGNFSCQMFISSDNGENWLGPREARGGDKAWMVVDRSTGPGAGNIYANWTRAVSSCNGQFTASYDGGLSYLTCQNVPSSPQWGTLAVGPTSELYIGGIGFIVVKSTTIHDSQVAPVFQQTVHVDLDGTINFGGGPNPGGLLGQAWIAVDLSDGPSRGFVYMLASVQRFSIADPMDVMFARSLDGGLTWSDPVRINDDSENNGAYQWFGTMSVAPSGRIDVIWNDTRANPGAYDSELYYAYSLDAGETWSPNEPVSPSFDPHLGWPNQNKLGDYYDMISDETGASVAYAATFNGEQDVYFLRIYPSDCNGNGIDDEDEIAADHNCCEFGGGLGCNDPTIEACVCGLDPYCCDVEWDRLCADLVIRGECGVCPATDCNGNEVPDECEADCNHNGIADACEVAADHDCCATHDTPGCSDEAIETCVCAIDPYCCEFEWDERCAERVHGDGCGACPIDDCNGNGQPDECDISRGFSADCNADGAPDDCSVATGPTGVLLCPGETATFHASATNPAFGYQWLRNGEPLSDGGRIVGATTPQLVITDVVPDDDNDLYSCEIRDGCRLDETAPAVLDVIILVDITKQPSPARDVCAGTTVTLTVEHAGGTVAPGYQWYAGGEPLVNNAKYSGVRTAGLSIHDVGFSDAGVEYTCLVYNECESVLSEPGSIRVVTPQITQQPMDGCGELGETVTLSVSATSPLEPVYYQWRKEGTAVAGGPVLTLADLEAEDAGEYYAVMFTLSPTCLTTSQTATVQVGDCPTCSTPGDMDSDGDHDLADLYFFMLCYREGVLDRPECACANTYGADWQIDLADWEALAPLIAGPQ